MSVAPVANGFGTDAGMQRDSLQPKLEQAQQALDVALDEACGVDLKMANTAEMILIEETLAIATNAAKEVVSVRLRRRARKTAPRRVVQEPSPDQPIDRVFDDTGGKRWHAYAVYPSAQSKEKAVLPESAQKGWLCFESHDELRRITPIPGHWRELAEEELRELCLKAEGAPKHL